MARIDQTYTPGKNTAGSIGDIWVNTTTGISYECIGVYRFDTYEKTEIVYDWKVVKSDESGGNDGENGVSPIVNVTSIDGGHRVTITDVNGDKIFDVMDGNDGSNITVVSSDNEIGLGKVCFITDAV